MTRMLIVTWNQFDNCFVVSAYRFGLNYTIMMKKKKLQCPLSTEGTSIPQDPIGHKVAKIISVCVILFSIWWNGINLFQEKAQKNQRFKTNKILQSFAKKLVFAFEN